MDVAVYRHSLDDTVWTQAISSPGSPSGLLGLFDPGERWKRPFAKEVSTVYLKDRVIPSLSMSYYTK